MKDQKKDILPPATPRDASRTSQLVALEVGEYITDASYHPAPLAAGVVTKAKAAFNSLWAANISRAKQYTKKAQFKTKTFAAIDPDGDVVVTLIIQRTA